MSSLDRDQKVAPTDHRRRKGLRVSIASCSAASVKRGASGAERLAASALLLLLARLSAQPLVPVDSIRCFRPSGVPADSGLVVRVTGVFSATGQFGSWGPGFVQDNTAGVAVYDSAVARFAIGDSVLITARIDFYNGLTELKNPSISRISSGHELEPRPILIAQMGDTLNNRELYEGRLVTCHGIFDTTGTFQGNRSYPFRDASGRGTVYVDSNVSDILGRSIPGDTTDLVGCVSQYDRTAPYFSGYQLMPRSASDITGSSPGSIMTIAGAFVDADSNTIPDLLDSVVTVTGIVTVPTGVLSRTKTDIYIQDRTAGCNVYSPSIARVYRLGDSLVVTGKVTVYRGKLELVNPQIAFKDSGHSLPEPVVITCRELSSTRRWLGSIVALRGVTTNILVVQSGSNTVFDTSGAANMYVSSSSDVPGFILVRDTFTLVGVKSQYGPANPPYRTGYELIPRFCTDFSRGLEAELPLLTIGEVQQPGPDGFSSKYEGQFVKIQGRISGPSYVYGSGSSPSCYLEDTAGGINVYAPVTDSLSGLLLDSLGVEFLCIGRVTEYNGLTELANGVVRIADRAPVPVRPRILGFNRFLSEELESKLISVAGDVITPPAQAGGGVNFTIKNGNAGITIRVVSGAPIPLNWVTTGKRVYCTGIVGQYSTTAPFGDGYQLMPRLPEDLVDSTPGLQFDAAMRIEPEPRVFNPGQGEVCRISITSPADRRLDLQVFDLEGRLVRELLVSVPGHSYQVVWDGTDDRFRRLPLGTYILNLKGLRDNGRVEAQCKLVVIGARF